MPVRTSILAACVLFLLCCVHGLDAGVRSGILREAYEFLQRRFSSEITKEFGESGATVLARKMESLAAKHGDELVANASKVGPRMFRYIEELDEDGTLQALKLMSRQGDEAIWVVSKPGRFSLFMSYGDDAADAMIKHREISEGLITSYGRSGAKAMNAVNGPNARRLARMANEGDLAKISQPDEVLDTIGRYGDRAADWVWQNKGALAVASIATAFVANPEPFLNGAVEVVQAGADSIVRPVVSTAANSINWNVLLLIIGLIGVLPVARLSWRWKYPRRATL